VVGAVNGLAPAVIVLNDLFPHHALTRCQGRNAEVKEDVMARNTLNRTLDWLATRTFTTLKTRFLMALASMSAIVAAQAPSTRHAPMERTVDPQIVKVSGAYTRAILSSDAPGLAALFTIDGYLLPPHVPAAKG
jgi:hypothetical protein